jgi:hypothetical protein
MECWKMYIFLRMDSTNESTKYCIFRVGECKYKGNFLFLCMISMHQFQIKFEESHSSECMLKYYFQKGVNIYI